MKSAVSPGAVRVLLIEDSREVRRRLRSLIEESCHADVIDEVDTAAGAIALIRAHQPDAVVLDLNLADGDGSFVLREIKRTQPACVVMVLTSFANQECREFCLNSGADYFFDKSQDFEQVPEVLRDLVRAGEGSQPSQARESATSRPEPAMQQVGSEEASELAGSERAGVDFEEVLSGRKEFGDLIRETSHLRTTLDEHAIVSIADGKGKITYVNDKFCKISQYTREELIGQDHRIVNSGYHPKTFMQELWRTITQGRTWQGEIRNKAKDGSYYWVEATIVPFLTAEGQITQYVSIRTDITAQKLAEEAVIETGAQFRATFEQAAVGMAQVGLDGRWLRVNVRLCGILGYSREELMQKTFQELTHPDDLNADLDYVNQVLAGKLGTYTLEKRYIRKDGSIVPANLTVSLVHDASGKPKYFVSVVEDITARNRVEGELRASEQRFRIAAETANDVIYEWDLKQSVQWLGKIDEMLGYESGEFPRTLDGWAASLHPDDRERVMAAVQAHLQGHAPFAIDYRIRRKDGTYRWWLARGAVARTPDGNPFRWIGSTTDITDRKLAVEYREMGLEILQILNESGAFMASVQRVVATLKTRTGFDAIGLRLQEGEDFPYAAQQGFSDDFMLGENSLLARTADGELCRHKDGTACLECTCGLVISGRIIPGNPLFTSGGSCWSNDAEKIPVFPVSEEPRIHPRNHCIHHGYASVALVPIKNEHRVIGLIQLNDRRKSCFTLSTIEQLEDIATHIGGALMRKQAEAKMALALTEAQRLRQALDHVPAYVYIKDPEFRYVYANYLTLELLGCSPEKLRGCDDSQFFPPNAVNRIREIDARVIRGEQTGEEIVVRKADGGQRVYWEVKSPIYAEAGNKTVLGILGISTDITARKATERQLRERNEILSKSHEGVMIVDLEDKVTFWNHGAETMLGWTAAEALGQLPKKMLGVDDLDLVTGLRAEVEAAGFWNGEVPARTREGHKLTLDCHTTLVRDEAGRPRARLNLLVDITEKKLLEEKFLHAQRMEAIGTLASGVAHDLNNILAPILMVAGLLKENLTSEKDREILAMVERSGQRGAAVIRQLLSFSRGQAGERVLVQPKHLIHDMVQIVHETFPPNITVGESVPADLWTVEADPTQLHQVILNLCVNARDAMPAGGKLTLTATNVLLTGEDVRLHVGASPGAHVMITLTDSGQGIPAEILPRIFEPFFTTKEIGKGTGLGLSTVASIVKNHGGFLTVYSQPGWGTVFKVHLPAATGAVTAETGATGTAAQLGNFETVLVVDDEPAIRETMRRTLEEHNYRVLLASNGEQAIRVFLKHGSIIRVVLTDMIMPGMDGLALIRALRVMDSGLRIVACSGSDQQSRQADFADLGIEKYLAKPFSPARLLETVGRALTKKA